MRDRMSRNIIASVSYVRGFFSSADGTRRIHVDKKCKDVIQDFEEYRYPETEDGKPIKEEPIKDGHHDHGNDAFRYFITNRFPMKNNQLRKIQR
jgi:phage terminase large subunit